MKKYLLVVLCLTATVFGINKKYRRPQANTVGLIAHYKLWDGLMTTGKVFDYSLNGHGGTLNDTDTPITLVPTYPGFDFDGSNDYIEIADHGDFSPGDSTAGSSTPFSISAWVYMHDATNFMIASKGVSGTDAEWRIFCGSTDPLYSRIQDNSATAWVGRRSVALTAYENQWVHIVTTYDGGILSSGVKLYINGVRADTADSENGTFVAVENLDHAIWIGRYGTSYANGLIENVMFFSIELSVLEVKNLYEISRWRYKK